MEISVNKASRSATVALLFLFASSCMSGDIPDAFRNAVDSVLATPTDGDRIVAAIKALPIVKADRRKYLQDEPGDGFPVYDTASLSPKALTGFWHAYANYDPDGPQLNDITVGFSEQNSVVLSMTSRSGTAVGEQAGVYSIDGDSIVLSFGARGSDGPTERWWISIDHRTRSREAACSAFPHGVRRCICSADAGRHDSKSCCGSRMKAWSRRPASDPPVSYAPRSAFFAFFRGCPSVFLLLFLPEPAQDRASCCVG